jgi:DNA-binding NarL/FixJ family response regulator
MPDEPRRILIGSASAVVRAGLETLLGANPNLSVSSRPLNQLDLDALQPEVLLLDLDLPEEAQLLQLAGGIPLVVLCEEPLEALRLGARAVLPPTADGAEILCAIEAAALGLVIVHPDTLETLVPLLPTGPRPVSQSLTPREIEVLGMLAEGLGNKNIARHLGISEHTVKFHIGSLFTKLNASSRTEAVTLGARQGLIML